MNKPASFTVRHEFPTIVDPEDRRTQEQAMRARLGRAIIGAVTMGRPATILVNRKVTREPAGHLFPGAVADVLELTAEIRL